MDDTFIRQMIPVDEQQLPRTLCGQFDQMNLTHELSQQTVGVDEHSMPQRPREGHRIRVTGVVGIFTDPAHVIHYTSNDEVRQEFTVVYRGENIGGHLMTSDESTRVEWMPIDRISALTMDPSQRKRIAWALDESVPYIDPETR